MIVYTRNASALGGLARLAAAAVGVLLAAAAAMLGPALSAQAGADSRVVASRTAAASDAPITPVRAEVSSATLKAPLAASDKSKPEVLDELVHQVDWVAGRKADAPPTDIKALGPKYTLVLVYSNGKAEQWDLYPYAATGPYIYQPSPQPGNRKITATWHLGRLSMVDVFCDQGVSAPGTDDCKLVEGKGAGGGAAEVLSDKLEQGFGQWRDSLYTVAGAIGTFGVLVFLFTLRSHRRTG